MTLLLSNSDVEQALTPGDTIDATEKFTANWDRVLR
jgi:hypothetical protein